MIRDTTSINTVAHHGLLIFATPGLHRAIFGKGDPGT